VHLILASTSARRRQLLTAAGYTFDVNPVDVDETRLDGESPRAYVARVAADKARAGGASDAVSLGADTVVVDGGTVLGKPFDANVATEMLSALSGGTHQVLSGWACINAGEILASGVEVTEVTFRPLSEDEISAYITTGEPLDRAGAYAIQGGAGAFVASLDGSYTNVMGLPMEAVSAALADLGIEPVAVG
jgi:septum formation protein